MVTTIVPPTITSGGTLTYAPAPQGMAYKYDRLNRLKSSQAWQNLNTVNNVWESGLAYAGMYENTFSYDANGNITSQLRKDATGAAINDLTYNRRNAGGKTVQNRLYHVNDAVSSTAFTDDIDDQGTFINNETVNTANNYGYDEIGNLNRNDQKEIEKMVYTVTGKVKEVHRTVGSTKENLKFDFDANGNRIAKHVYTSDDVWMKSDYYVNDAQGNNMAIYTLTGSSGAGLSYKLNERNIYGSSRVGTNKTPVEMIGATLPVDVFSHTLGDINYYLSNHTNNNLVTVTDKKLPIDLDGDFIIDEYWPHVISSADYYGYGVKMKERSFSTESTRYQFNGKEYDSETETSDFGARNLDGDLGIWGTRDPQASLFNFLSPYSSFANNPIYFVDEEGEVVKVAGDLKIAQEDVLSILPSDEYKSKISVVDGIIIFDLTEKQALESGDPGVISLYNLVNSEKVYLWEVADKTEIRNPITGNLDIIAVDDLEGASKEPDRLVRRSVKEQYVKRIKRNGDEVIKQRTVIKRIAGLGQPKDVNVDFQRTIAPNYTGHDKNNPRVSIVLHEFLELEFEGEKGLPYSTHLDLTTNSSLTGPGAHNSAINEQSKLPSSDPRKGEHNGSIKIEGEPETITRKFQSDPND
ncbi:MAG: hypothetical protein KFKLKKLM_01608 [Flavobacteriales bacterium]|nr:hypothetical protein [Flavobacteriales bacterium]